MKKSHYFISALIAMRNRHFFLIDVVFFLITPIFATAIRLEGFDFLWQIQPQIAFIVFIFTSFKLATFLVGGLYNRMWQHASVDELGKIIVLGLIVLLGESVLFYELCRQNIMGLSAIPQSVPIIDGFLTILVIGGLRFSIRLSERVYQRSYGKMIGKPVLIVGAGDAGVMIAQELQSNPQIGLIPVGFIDDDHEKKNLRIRGISVLGGRELIPEAVISLDIHQIIIAIPTVSGKVIRDIEVICSKTGVKTRIIPGVFELLDGSVSIKKLRDLDIEDLLRREPVTSDVSQIKALLKGKKILVTGAGGSIGSEICRQIARCNPAQLIVLGHGENSIFNIAGELSKSHPDLKLSTVIADVRDEKRIQKIFARFRPQIVYHAAAHKHVPLMESNPVEAISNNVIGTYNVTKAAVEIGVERFLLISTDKAVNPTSVMGATKNIAELIVKDAANRSGKPFVAVRFGNVLGSRGSVVPIFRDQIAHGGPITITHPDVKRYFMTIPEAVQLVLFSASMGKGGEVFVLDMGEPVKISDLAKDLIRLSGLELGKDIDITYSGLRPGEKLFEELLLDEESFEKTIHRKIFICRNGTASREIQAEIAHAKTLVLKASTTELGRFLEEMIPGFQFVGGAETF